MRFFAKILLPSMMAASLLGPKMRSPRRSNSSTMPKVRATSGPTTVRSIRFRSAKSASGRMSEALILTLSATSLIPAFPGAAQTLATFGLWAIFQASACSLPPEPITSTCMDLPDPPPIPDSVVEMSNPREDHGDVGLIGRLDHLCVTNGTARLDDRGDTGWWWRINPGAKGKEAGGRQE